MRPTHSHVKTPLAKVLVALAVVLVAILGGGAWWLSDYYHADTEALAAASDEDGTADGVTVRLVADDALAFVPAHIEAGLVFYPGAKVQPEAYAPLLTRCAREGILCVLVRPPFNIAFFDPSAATYIREAFPEVESWFVGGHSMGGVVAMGYLDRHEKDCDGAVLLASYPSSDVSDYRGAVLSLYGTADGVLDRGEYERAVGRLPASTTFEAIEGGNHAHFGNYGEQAGDGAATISRESQQTRTADAIHELVSETVA